VETFDPHVEAAQLAAASFRPLALRALREVQSALGDLGVMAMFAPEPLFASAEVWDLLGGGQRCAKKAAAFVDQAIGALDPYCDVSFPRQRTRRTLVRYYARGRAELAMEGGCTRLGWRARVQAQRVAGVRALYMAIGCALMEDLDRLTDLAPVLDDHLPKEGPARQRFDAFQLGLGHLVGLIELLADVRRVDYYTTSDGRRMVEVFGLADTD
jgi:hypothetical protein